MIKYINISKGSVFCYYENIESYADYVFNKLNAENYLINAGKDAIYDRFSFYMSEINALHPFREGNGRSQRVFMSYLARVAGYELNFEEITQEKMIELSSLAFNNGHEEYIKMFKEITRSISNQEQMNFIESIDLKSIAIKNRITLKSIKQDTDKYRSDNSNNKNTRIEGPKER